jgi:hypothetical protein
MVVVVAVVVKSHAVELFEWVSDLAHWRCETRVKRNTLDLGRSDIHTVALLHIAEVGCLDTSALVWNNRWLHVPQKRPLCSAEEGGSLDIRCSSTRAQTTGLIFDE